MRMTLSCFIALCLAPYTALASTPTPMGKYGLIQNVQNYSSNPYWTSNSPYNLRMPTPVYATGPDIETSDCQTIVSYLIATECEAMNKCVSAHLSDIRPSIMLQLSRIPNGNYATSCGGYIDTAFDQYIQQNAIAAPDGYTAFPDATTAPSAGSEFEIQNPFAPQLPEWQSDMLDRKQELLDLQAMNGAGNIVLEKSSFPTTSADISFSDSLAMATSDYQQYKDKSAYHPVNIEDQQIFANRTNPQTQKTAPLGKDSKKKDDSTSPDLITENIPDEFEALLPWYGILVVKAGSLDEYAKQELPIISTEYMKSHRDDFYPENSSGMGRGCTYHNHMANDNDVINRATHITMKQDDNWWSGSDFYVFDGSSVYWGWATIAGEVALALATLGLSAEATAAKTAVQLTNTGVKAIKGSSSAFKSVKLTKDISKLEKARDAAVAAKATKKGATAAEATANAATRKAAVDALADAGITFKRAPTAKTLNNVGNALKTALANNTAPVSWTSSLWRPWRLVASGAKDIVPRTANALGPGAKWSQRFATLAIAGGAVGANYLGRELLKSFGYSTAALKDPTTGDISFNSFGLLSDDNEEGRENVVSHGAWIQFETIGTKNEDDALNEAVRFAEELTQDINDINATDPQCNVDIYVVQPAISNPKKLPGAKAIWYIIQNNNTDAFKVRT